MFSNSSFLLRQRRFLLTGLFFSRIQHTLSTDEVSRLGLRLFVVISQVSTGSMHSSSVGLKFALDDHRAWTRSVAKPLIVLLLGATFIYFLKLFRNLTSQRKIFITWMRRDVSGVAGENSLVASTLCLIPAIPNIGNAVQILNSLQLLNVFVLMGVLSSQDLCLLARSLHLSGLQLTQNFVCGFLRTFASDSRS